MIAAPAFRCGRAACVRKNMPKMFVWKVRRSCSSVMSVMSLSGCCSPALLTRMSSRRASRPPRATAVVAERLVADVAGDRDRAAALDRHDLGGLRRILMLVEVEDRDVGALAREQRRDRPADAAVAAGDERDLALEPARAGIARRPFGLRLELRLLAGQAVLVDHRFGGGHALLLARALNDPGGAEVHRDLSDRRFPSPRPGGEGYGRLSARDGAIVDRALVMLAHDRSTAVSAKQAADRPRWSSGRATRR